MKKKTSYLLISSVLGGAGMLAAPAAWADCTDPDGATVTCNNTVSSSQGFSNGNQTITIEQGTAFNVSNTQYAIFFRGDDSTLTNNATITTSGDSSDGIWFYNNARKTIINTGTIATLGNGSDGIEFSEITNSAVKNSGTIATAGEESHGLNVNGGASQNTITNTGRIVTTGGGSDGIYAANSSNNTLINTGNITVNGVDSSGIYVGSYAKNYEIQNQAGGVIYAPNGNGIQLLDNGTVNQLQNDGIIDGGQAGIYVGDNAQVNSIINTGIIIGGGSGSAVVFEDTGNTNLFLNQGVIGALEGDAIRAENNINITNGINNEGIIIGRVNAPGSNMSNSGIFELLSSSNPSTVNNYNQSASGVLALQADSTSRYGQLQVAGDASLNGRTLVVTRGSTNFADGDELVDVVTASNITGTPSAVLDDSLRYQFVQEQTGTSYSLKIVDTSLTTVTNAITTTSSNPALTSVGTVIDTIIVKNNVPPGTLPGTTPTSLSSAPNCNGALASTVCAITSSFNASQIHKNVVQLAPLMDGSMPYIEMNNLRAFGDIVGSRQESVRGQGYTSEFNPEKYLWIRPVGRWDNQSTRGDYAGYNADTRGIAIGADGLVLDRTRLGLALGMSRTDVNDTSDDIRHDARVDSWNLLAYGGFDFTPDTAMTWQTGFGRNTTKGNRYLNIENPTDGSTAYNGVARSDYDSHTFQAGLGLQSTFHPMDVVTLTPELRTDYYRVKDKGYKESGADDVGLQVDGATTEALVVSSKLKAGLKLSEIVGVHGYVGAGYDTMNDRSETQAAFIGSADTPFTYRGMSESPWIAMAGVGVTAKFSDVLDGTVQYDAGQRTKFTSQSVSLKVRYAF